MKMRLIDADALTMEMDAGCMPITEWGISGITGDESCIKDYIDAAPTIEAEPVKHGEWKPCFEDYRKQIEGNECSACGFQIYGSRMDMFRYCPNCGAKMEEDK